MIERYFFWQGFQENEKEDNSIRIPIIGNELKFRQISN